MIRKLIFALLLLTLPAFGTTYYVSISSGSDANTSAAAQSKSTPWAHLPGMRSAASNAAGYTPVAGDTFILRGCDVWTGTDMPITWHWSGTAGNPITIGVDQTWLNATNCPSGWNRPVLNAGLAVINPPECTNDNVFLRLNSTQWVTFDNIEITGFFWASMVGNGGACGAHSGMVVDETGGDHITLSNWYIHHWNHGGTSSTAQDTDHAINIENGTSPYCPNCLITNTVIDNTDGPGNPGCTGGPCGFGVQWSITNSYLNYMINAIKPKTHSGNIGGNTITGVQGPSFDGTHENIIEPVQGGNPVVCCYYIHDNYIHDNPLGELQFGNTGETYYIWNNVHIAASSRSWAFPQQPGPGMSLFMWNNTIVPQTGQPGILTCNACNPATWTTVLIQNNHVITTSTSSNGGSPAGLIGCSDCGATSPFPVTGARSFTNNTVMTPTVATAQGYTGSQTYVYSPTAITNSTVGAGLNETSSWPSGFPTNDATYAVTKQTISGVVQAVASGRPTIARPVVGPWNAGAYQFPAAGPSFFPLAYAGMDIVIPSSNPPNLGGLTNNGATVVDNSYVSHGQPVANLSPITRCTDQNFAPGGLSGFAAGQGGAGDAIMWNKDSTLLHVVAGNGGSTIALFNSTTGVCSPAITADKNLSHPGSSSVAASFGKGQFSTSSANTWWAFGVVGTDITTRTVVTPFTINTSTGTFTEGAAAADFQFGLPIGSNAPEWQANHAYSLGAYVSHTMVPGEFFPYQSNYAGFHLGDIVWPTYPTGCGFVLQATGTTGGSPPNWSSAANCGQNATAFSDGTAKWRSLVGPPKFIFQLTSASGTSGSSTPAFVPVVTKHPDVLSTVSDNGMTWTNVGVNVTVPLWGSNTTVSPDGTKFVQAWSIQTYGADPTSLGGSNNACTYANCSGDQGTGTMGVTYDSTANVYNLYNTLTQIQTRITCVGGSGFNCAGGSLLLTPLGKATSVTCPFYLHEAGAYLSGLVAWLGIQTSYLGASCPSPVATLWNPYQTFNASTQAVPFRTAQTHTAYGYNHAVSLGQDGSNYGFQSGAYAVSYPTSNVTSIPPIVWQATPCATVPSPWFPGDATAPCQLQIDDHLSWAYNPGDDSTPVCSTFYNYSISTANGPIPVAPYQGEVACFSTNPSWTSTATPNPAQKQWRFAHTYATQSNPNFNIQFQIGQLSQDGRFYAFGTDWGGQFGSTTGAAPILPIANSSVSCLGGYLWQSSHTYALGTVINPVPSLNGGGTPYHAYQAVAVTTGISGSTAPAWNITVQGSQIVDGGVTWQDLGPGNCRGDVVVVQLSGIPPPANAVTFSPVAGTYTGSQAITLSTTSPNAIICWNTTGSPQTNRTNSCTNGTLYTGFVTVTGSETIFAVAGGLNYLDSSVSSAVYVIKTTAAAPTFSPGAGTYSSTQSVALSTVSGTVICYTTNGTTPATNGTTGCTAGTLYTTPVSVAVNETLKAIAGGTTFTDSPVSSAAYVIKPFAATPTFSPIAGTYTGTQSVTISALTGTVICYTTNGSIPATNGTTGCTTGTLYTTPVSVAASETVKAIAGGTNFTDGTVGSAAYIIQSGAAIPTFSPVAGTYTGTQSVTITTASGGAIICYNTTGSPHTNGVAGCAAGSTLYTAPVNVSVSSTLFAVAGGTGFTDSTVGSAAYVIRTTAATPTFAPVAGTYTGSQNITIKSTSSGSVICYTMTGVTPATNGASGCAVGILYTVPVLVAVSQTLKAIAGGPGYTDSSVATAAYVINVNANSPTYSPVAGTYATSQSVTISTTAGGVICYTTNGAAPKTNGTTGCTTGTLYTTPVSVSVSLTLKAIAGGTGFNDSSVRSGGYVIRVAAATPTFSPVAGTYTGSQSVTISTATGTVICYTVNGTTPATNGGTGCTTGTLYAGPFTVASSLTLKAIAGGSIYNDSSVGSAAYTINFNATTPTFSPVAGTYNGAQAVTITSSGGVICYTTNGSTPATNGTSGCTAGTLYTTPVTVSSSLTLKAIGGGTGFNDSAVGSAAYTINTGAATPTFSPLAGTYASTQSVSLSSTSGGAVICYTLNGTTPSTNGVAGCTVGTLYSGAISVSISETIKAVAGGTGFIDSSVGTAAYVIRVAAATPTFSPVAGTYTGSQSVTISTVTGTVLCYTLDGSTPATDGASGCTTGTLYVTPVTVGSSLTLKAIAGGSIYNDSSVGSAAYTIKFNATTPVFSPLAGAYTGTQVVTITSSGGVICYNTTGSPATNGASGCTTGTLYSGPVTVAATETLFAVGGGTGFNDSPVGSAAYTIRQPASTPIFSPVAGTYGTTQFVSLTSSPGAIICWNLTGSPATNGTTGCTTGNLYTGAIVVSASETIFAVGGGTAFVDSSAGSAVYVIKTPASKPTFSPMAGTYVGTQTVTISAVSGGTICYNFTGAPQTDGASGCTIGTLYTGPVTVSSSSTLFAVAGGASFTDGPIASAIYTISTTAALPSFNPPGGAYAGTQTVAIGSISPGAIICWNTTGAPSTNGSTGCTTGTLYTGPVTVSSTTNLFAVAGGTGYSDSAVALASYVISPPPTGSQIVGNGTISGTGTIQ